MGAIRYGVLFSCIAYVVFLLLVILSHQTRENATGPMTSYLTLRNTGTPANVVNVVGSTVVGSSIVGSTLVGSTMIMNANDNRRKVVLSDGAFPGDPNRFYGIGYSSHVVNFQVDDTGDAFAFYAGSTSAQSVEVMRVTGTGRIGIGTSAPLTSLDVRGMTYNRGNDQTWSTCFTEWRDYNAVGRLLVGTDGNGLINTETGAGVVGTWTSNSLIFATNAAERVRISATGNVGIGTVTFRGTTTISTLTGSPYGLYIDQGYSRDNNGLYISNSNYGSDQGISIGMTNAGGSNFNSYARIQGKTSGVAGTTHLSLQPDGGNVGIGITNPSYPLTIARYYQNGGTHAEATDSAISLTTTGGFGVGMRLRVGQDATINASDLQFTTCNNSGAQLVRMTILGTSNAAGGNVGIGTDGPLKTLHVFGTDQAQLVLQGSATGNTYSAYYWTFGHNTADGAIYLQSSYSGTASMYVRANNSNTVGWQVYSDRRLKENIEPLDRMNMLERIRKIKPVTFNMRCPHNNATQRGVIAQDVQEVFPEIVSESLTTVLDVENPLGISLTGFVVPLLSAVQVVDQTVTELSSINASLEARLAVVESQLSTLAARLAAAGIA